MKRGFALCLLLVLLLLPGAVLAEKIRIEDTTTGLVMIYDTETGLLLPENPLPEEPEISKEEPEKDEKEPIPGLLYSREEKGAPGDKRALVGSGYVVEGRNDALNGAMPPGAQRGKLSEVLKDKEGNRIASVGLLYVYELGRIRPDFRVEVDGDYSCFF